MMLRRIVLLVLACSLAAQVAPASIMLYMDQANWVTAVGGVYDTETFEGASLNTGLSYSGCVNCWVMAEPANAANHVFRDWAAAGEGTTRWSFAQPVIGVGATWNLAYSGPGVGLALKLFYTDGTEYTISREIENTINNVFIGLVSSKPFDAVRVLNGTQPDGGAPDINEETYYFDNLVYAHEKSTPIGDPGTVPEPQTWALCGAGLAALAWRARRSGTRG